MLSRRSFVSAAAAAMFCFALGLSSAYAQTIAFVQSNDAVPEAPQSTVTVRYTGAQTVGNLNVVVIGWNDATSNVTSVTDSSGNVYAPAIGPTVQPGIQTQVVYFAP